MNTPKLEAIREIAREAGELTLQYFRHGARFTEKSDHQGIVTEADLAAEKLIKNWIAKEFPDHSILAEESGMQRGAASASVSEEGPIWLIDPLDGTTNFARGDPHYCVSIGFGHRRAGGCELQAGVIYKPATRECFSAARGQGAWLGETRLHVSPEKEFKLGTYRTGIGPSREAALRKLLEAAFRVQNACTGSAVRIAGSAALDLAYVAAGFTEGFWEPDLNPWDTAAGALIVTEAGGVVTNPQGVAFDTLRDRGIVCASPQLHPRLLELIS